MDLSDGDYDYRTALHLAASEGHLECVKFIINALPTDRKSDVLSQKDRWGGTPLGDALRYEHYECADILREAGAQKGTSIQ